jgi:hypothetical protein
MTIGSFARKMLPRRIYEALVILKHGPLVRNGIIGPSMITKSEQAFFTECARGPLPPGGKIVDLGCFMGSTAIALAWGIAKTRRKDEVLAYDLFEWADWMQGMPTYGIYRPGENFLPEARRYARDHGGGLIKMEQADLTQYEWDGRPIALLLVDAMKNRELARQIARSFYPSLLPGAVLIHQDFKHWYTSWIHVLQFRLRDHFRFLESVLEGGTVAFTVTSEIPPHEVDQQTEWGFIANDEVDAAFQDSISLVPPDQAANIAAAHVFLYHQLERNDQALMTLEKYRALGLDNQGEFPAMKETVGPVKFI